MQEYEIIHHLQSQIETLEKENYRQEYLLKKYKVALNWIKSQAWFDGKRYRLFAEKNLW